jgi:hypothetical protein
MEDVDKLVDHHVYRLLTVAFIAVQLNQRTEYVLRGFLACLPDISVSPS